MATHVNPAADDPVVPPHGFVVGATTSPASRPGEMAAVEQVLQLLARALRQFHTYPATSPLCADAIAACASALAGLEGRDQVALRVMIHDLLVDEHGIGAGTIVEYELVRRLHRAGVAAVAIDRAASARDLSRFCVDLISLDQAREGDATLPELLVEHGIDKIVARNAYRPEIVDLGAPRAAVCDLVEHERGRRDTAISTGPTAHLYPPDKGWIRLDPAAPFAAISLVDLAVLVNDPCDFAAVLLRLTDGEPAGAESHQTALEQKFNDVATLFASLDPRLAQVMFAKLARAVLELEPDQRQSLLRRTILPGMLDGRPDGRVLTEFPDVDLADSLCLLLDLETAAPEVLSAALDRLNLPADRRQTLAPLLDAGIRERARAAGQDARAERTGADRHAHKLLQIDAAAPGNFAEFAAFDLSLDAATAAAIDQVRADVETGDALVVRMRCLSNLVRLEPNPGAVERFLADVSALLAELERASRWQDVASWLVHHRELAASLRQLRPDVADAIARAMDAFCTRERALALVDLFDGDTGQRDIAGTLIEAYGPAVAPFCVALLDDASVQPKIRSLPQLMREHAAMLAPALAKDVGRAGTTSAAIIVRVLGFAGPGCETAIAGEIPRGDEQVVREALRALTRIGSPEAASLVAAQIQHASAWVRTAAQEALCRFPPARAQVQLLDLLGRRDFVRRHPDAAARLMDRAAQTDPGSLAKTVAPLAPLRFCFWNPALARVGAKARGLVRRDNH